MKSKSFRQVIFPVRKQVKMMKTIYIFLLLFFIYSCEEKNDEIDNEISCIESVQNDNWETESFKTNYSIQFPSNYVGQGMGGFEGNIFDKKRNDSLVEFNYFYCSPLYCEDFGDTLANPIPNSLFALDNQNNEAELNEQVLFCDNSINIGILYHNLNDSAVGKYFMKIDSFYLEAVSIYYEIGLQSEVESIIKTIQSN